MIYSTDDFNATEINPQTVALKGVQVHIEGKGTYLNYQVDFNDDGLLDLLVHVDTELLGDKLEGSTVINLTAKTWDGKPVIGTAIVEIVP